MYIRISFHCASKLACSIFARARSCACACPYIHICMCASILRPLALTLCATQRSSSRPRFSRIRASSWACLLLGRLYLCSLYVHRCISTFILTASSFCSTVNELFQLYLCLCLYRLLGSPVSLVFVAWKLWRAEPPYYSIFCQQRLYEAIFFLTIFLVRTITLVDTTCLREQWIRDDFSLLRIQKNKRDA